MVDAALSVTLRVAAIKQAAGLKTAEAIYEAAQRVMNRGIPHSIKYKTDLRKVGFFALNGFLIRKLNGKYRSLSQCAGCCERPLMGDYEFLGYGKSKPHAAAVACAGFIRSVETVEDLPQLLRLHADSSVGDRDSQEVHIPVTAIL